MPFGLLSFIFAITTSYTQLPSWQAVTGIASFYHPGDGHCGPYRADGRRFRKTDFHLAHRSLPLGLPVIVENLKNGLWTSVIVRDRGPFGFCVHKTRRHPHCPRSPNPLHRGRRCPRTHRWVVRTRLRRNECGYYRGVVDLTVPVARKIGAFTFTPVKLWVPKRKFWHKWLNPPNS
jgi:hypothetical protein